MVKRNSAPAAVAKVTYEAFTKGDKRIISGFMPKGRHYYFECASGC
jgi:hypothetical protein